MAGGRSVPAMVETIRKDIAGKTCQEVGEERQFLEEHYLAERNKGATGVEAGIRQLIDYDEMAMTVIACGCHDDNDDEDNND